MCNEYSRRVIAAQVEAAFNSSAIAVSRIKVFYDVIRETLMSDENDSVKLAEMYDALSLISETAEEMKTIITCAQAYLMTQEKLDNVVGQEVRP